MLFFFAFILTIFVVYLLHEIRVILLSMDHPPFFHLCNKRATMSVKLRKRALPSGKVQLYLDVYQSGSRHTEALGMYLNGDRESNKELMQLAQQIRTKRELELQADTNGLVPSFKRKTSFIAFYRALVEKKTSPNTRMSWNNALKHFIDCLGDAVTFANLSKEQLQKFKSYLNNQVSVNSSQIYFARIKTALYQAVKDGIIPANPAAFITIKKEEHLPVYLTIEEVRALAAAPCANENVKTAFLFSCFTGMRYSDVVALTWKKVKGERVEFTQQKTKTPGFIPLSAEAKLILERQRNAEKSSRIEKVFHSGAVFFLPRQSVVDKQLKAWGRAAGIEKQMSFHKARHTFATLSLTAGVDIYTTSKLLGHKNLQTTQIYAQVIDEKKRQAVAMLPRIIV